MLHLSQQLTHSHKIPLLMAQTIHQFLLVLLESGSSQQIFSEFLQFLGNLLLDFLGRLYSSSPIIHTSLFCLFESDQPIDSPVVAVIVGIQILHWSHEKRCQNFSKFHLHFCFSFEKSLLSQFFSSHDQFSFPLCSTLLLWFGLSLNVNTTWSLSAQVCSISWSCQAEVFTSMRNRSVNTELIHRMNDSEQELCVRNTPHGSVWCLCYFSCSRFHNSKHWYSWVQDDRYLRIVPPFEWLHGPTFLQVL